jgi:hypothetical protein
VLSGFYGRVRRLVWVLAILILVILAYICFSYFEARNRIASLATKVEQRVAVKSAESGKRDALMINRDGNALKGVAIPENTKLASIIDQLKLDADAGDAYSSCRLAMELRRCMIHEKREVPRMERLRQFKELTAGNLNANERDSRRVELSELRYTTNAHVCEGFKNSEGLSMDKYILQAALLGNASAKLHIAISEPMANGVNLDALAARHQYSKQFLQQMAQNGDEVALSELARQQIDGSWWDKLATGQSLSRNYFDAIVYALAADMRVRDLRAVDSSRQQFSYMNHLALNNRISDAELEQAQAKAQQLSKTFAPIAITAEANARRAALKEKYPEAIHNVLTCRE